MSDLATVNAAAMANLPQLCAELLPGGRLWRKSVYISDNPKHVTKSRNTIRVFMRTGRWQCLVGSSKGGAGKDPFSLVRYLLDLSEEDAAQWLTTNLGVE